MNTQDNDRQKLYEILTTCDDMCYAGQWKELIELGKTLVKDPDSTPSMLLMWVTNGKFAAYHGLLFDEYEKLLTKIDKRMEKELGRERTDKLLDFWKKQLAEVIAKRDSDIKKTLGIENPPGKIF
jgi:hypothetical protein